MAWSVVYKPTLSAGSRIIVPSAGILTLGGNAPNVVSPVKRTPLAGALTLTGLVPTVTNSGAAGSVPTNVMIILQGQSAQWTYQDGHSSPSTKEAKQSVGWTSVAGASSYNIYRSVTTVPGVNGAYTLYDSVSAATAASNYSTYVSNTTYNSGTSGIIPSSGGQGGGAVLAIAPGINCVYNDTAATGVTNNVVGPTGGYYFGPMVGYNYVITAVVSSVESAQSAQAILPYLVNGLPIFCDGGFQSAGIFTFYSANPGGVSPLGFANSVYVALNNTYCLPTAGGSGPQWNINVTSFNYVNFNFWITSANWASNTLGWHSEIDSDVVMVNPSTITIPTAYTAGRWNSLKIPFGGSTGFNTPFVGSGADATTIGVQQMSFYKTDWNDQNLAVNATFYVEIYFSAD